MKPKKQKPKKPLIERAWTKFFKKDFEGSETVFSDTIKEENNDEALYGRACSLFKQKEFDRALNDLNIFLKNNPKSYKAYHLRGLVKGSINKPKEALKDIEKSVKINPAYADGYYDMGGCYLILEEYQKAYDCFERCLTRDKNNAGAWFGKGMASLMNKEYNKAIEYFTITLRLDKKFILALMGRCEAYFLSGQKKESQKDLKRIKTLQPDILDVQDQYVPNNIYDDDNVEGDDDDDNDDFDEDKEIEDFRLND